MQKCPAQETYAKHCFVHSYHHSYSTQNHHPRFCTTHVISKHATWQFRWWSFHFNISCVNSHTKTSIDESHPLGTSCINSQYKDSIDDGDHFNISCINSWCKESIHVSHPSFRYLCIDSQIQRFNCDSDCFSISCIKSRYKKSIDDSHPSFRYLCIDSQIQRFNWWWRSFQYL